MGKPNAPDSDRLELFLEHQDNAFQGLREITYRVDRMDFSADIDAATDTMRKVNEHLLTVLQVLDGAATDDHPAGW